MGYSIYIKILARCTLKSLLEENQKNFINKTNNDIIFQKYLPRMREIYVDIITHDKLRFFRSIGELSMHDFQLSVTGESITNEDDLTDEEYEELEDYNMSTFVTCFFFEILLKAIDDNDVNIKEYCDIFEDLENIEYEDDKRNLIIFSDKSYKGSEKLNIDYLKISNSINYLKSRIPHAKITTFLGRNNDQH